MSRILLIIILSLVALSIDSGSLTAKVTSVEATDEAKNKKALTIKNIYDEMVRIGVKFPEIVLAQVRFETGHLKKVSHNNLLGFRSTGDYYKYESWEDCIAYLKGWQDRHYKGGSYYKFITKRKYAEDMPNYIIQVKKILKHEEDNEVIQDKLE